VAVSHCGSLERNFRMREVSMLGFLECVPEISFRLACGMRLLDCLLAWTLVPAKLYWPCLGIDTL